MRGIEIHREDLVAALPVFQRLGGLASVKLFGPVCMKQTIPLSTSVVVSHHQIGCCCHYCHSCSRRYQVTDTTTVYSRCSYCNRHSCGDDRLDKPLRLPLNGVRELERCIEPFSFPRLILLVD